MRHLATLALLLASPALAQGPGPGIDPVPISSLPFTISAPGAYYVTDDLTASTALDGIQILASNVHLNLNGHTLRGQGGGNVSGIVMVGLGREAITVTNGTLQGWSRDGIGAPTAKSVHVEGVRVLDIGRDGISVGVDSVVLRCLARGCTSNGIAVANNSRVVECTATVCKVAGIRAAAAVRIERCTAADCPGDGIVTSSECTVADSKASSNAGTGIAVDSSSTVLSCTSVRNGEVGIRVTNRCRVTDCTVNFTAGGKDAAAPGYLVMMFGNVLEGNVSNSNGIGYRIDDGANFVVRNVSTLEPTAFQFVGGNVLGPIVTPAGVATNTNPQANFDL